MPATKAATVNLYSFSPLSFGSTVLSDKSKRLTVSFPLTYVVFSRDYGFKDQRFVSVRCESPYTIVNTEKPFNTVDEVAAFLLYSREDLLKHFTKETLKAIKKIGIK